MRSSISALAVTMLAFAASAAEPQADAWVAGPERPSLNGESGKTWFSPVFGRRSGTFPAMYDSMQDERDTVAGDFMTARFRYTYDVPIGEGSELSPRHDESITEVLLDCGQQFSGTASVRYLLDGKEVARQEESGDGILMTQMNDAGTTVGDLCEFARQRGEK